MHTRVALLVRMVVRFVVAGAIAGAIAGVALSGCGPAPAPEARLLEQITAALGDPDTVGGVETMVLEGEGEIFALGQSRTLDGPLLKWQVTGYRRAIDVERGRWRDRFTQTAAFVTGWPDPTPIETGYADDVAFDVDGGQASRLDAITARDRRAEIYHSPLGFLRAALAAGSKLTYTGAEDIQQILDLTIANGERFTLYFDRATHLPQRILSKSHVAALGDVAVETMFSEFIEAGSRASAGSGGSGGADTGAGASAAAGAGAGGVGVGRGVKVPGRIVTWVDGKVVSDLRIKKAMVNPPPDMLGDVSAPADARTASASRPAHVTVEEAAPGVWYLAGEGHHSVVAEFADHLTLIEAPVDETRTLAVIAKARKLRPGKPLTQVINTHAHFDHSGGLRTAIAEGLTVITHETNRAFYERVATRPATIAPDALARHPKPLAIETVYHKMVLTDGTRQLEIYPVTDSPHCAAMLMVYFPREKLLVEADAYQPPPLSGPPPRVHPFAANLLDNIRTRGLHVDRLLPIHGRIATFADLVAAARTSPRPGTF